MEGLRPGALDLTGRQRCLWARVLRQLEAEGLLVASLPEALADLPAGGPPDAWIERAEARGQVVPWLLRQLLLHPLDVTLHALARDLGLCVDSRERLQCSPGWRHWTGLDSPAQGLGPWGCPIDGLALPERSRTLVLEDWARRLLCLWRAVPAEPAMPWRPEGLVLDLGGGQLQPLDEALVVPDPSLAEAARWQLGALPRHALDAPQHAEVRVEAGAPASGLRCGEGLVLPPPGIGRGPAVRARLQSPRPAAALLGQSRLGMPKTGPVLLLGADPGHPPQLCLALLQQEGGAWHHDASPTAMAGGSLCLDAQCRLLGYFRPMNTAGGRSLALLWS